MIRLFLGSIAAAVAMFVIGMVFFATPLRYMGLERVSDVQDAAVQRALAQNLPKTGTYQVPDAGSPQGTVMYGKGPIATIHYNTKGFPVGDTNALIGGFVHMVLTALLIAGALSTIDRRVPDFGSRAKLVVLMAAAASLFMHLGEPIWYHHDWAHLLYLFVADFVMFAAAGLILARWFMPVRAELAAPVVPPVATPAPSVVVEHPQEPRA